MSIFRHTFYHFYIRRVKHLFSKLQAVSSSGSVTENADTVTGVSSVTVNSSGSIVESSDIMDNSVSTGGRASMAFRLAIRNN